MALFVELVNLGSIKEPSIHAFVYRMRSNTRNTWFRKKVGAEYGDGHLLPALAHSESGRDNLEDLAQTAFELGRIFERATIKGLTLPQE